MGNPIQVKLGCKVVDNYSIKRKYQVCKFTCLQPTLALERETVHIDPVILFNRLTMLIKEKRK